MPEDIEEEVNNQMVMLVFFRLTYAKVAKLSGKTMFIQISSVS